MASAGHCSPSCFPVGKMGCSLNPLLLRLGWLPRSRGFPAQPTISSSCLLLDRLPEAHKGPQMEFWAMHCCALGPRPAGSRHYKSLALPCSPLSTILAPDWQHVCQGKGGANLGPPQPPFPDAPLCFPTSHLLVLPDRGCLVGRIFRLPHTGFR